MGAGMKSCENRITKIENKIKLNLKENEVIQDGLLKGITPRQLSEILKNVAGATRGLPNRNQTKIES